VVRKCQKHWVGWLVVWAAAICLLPLSSAASEPAKTSKKPTPERVGKQTVRHSSSRHHYVRRRRSGYRYRLARLQPDPSRIQEIQQALIREGYLKQEATGKWDEATRAAMRAFQQANGFEVTGLPEAKALMKLGLGPHPLPESVDPNMVGSARSAPPAATSSGAASASSPDQR
jgi:peptidoglycan hydrolase-like protein with peptidoglycan-binding domain